MLNSWQAGVKVLTWLYKTRFSQIYPLDQKAKFCDMYASMKLTELSENKIKEQPLGAVQKCFCMPYHAEAITAKWQVFCQWSIGQAPASHNLPPPPYFSAHAYGPFNRKARCAIIAAAWAPPPHFHHFWAPFCDWTQIEVQIWHPRPRQEKLCLCENAMQNAAGWITV